MKPKLIPHSKPLLGREEISAVSRILGTGMIAQGNMVEEFEKALSDKVKMKWGIATSSGTTALELSLRSLGIGRGDKVIMPSFVCTALLNAVYSVGAMPQIADIDADSLNISLDSVEKNISKKTKCIIIPHMFGKVVDITKFRKFGVPIIEDCAQTFGFAFNNHRGEKITVGSMGDISVFSFYATKLITSGEGGMVCTNSSEIKNNVIDLRDYDEKKPYRHRFNYKMTDIHACIGLSQLNKIDNFIKIRKRIANAYIYRINNDNFSLPDYSDDNIFYRFIVRLKKSGIVGFCRIMGKRYIIAKPPIFRPLHQYIGEKGFINSERAFNECVSIPLYPALMPVQYNYIINVLNRYKEEESWIF